MYKQLSVSFAVTTLLALSAHAQSQSGIDCGLPAFPAGSTCTDTVYGLGSSGGGDPNINPQFDGLGEYQALPGTSQFVTRTQVIAMAPDCGGETPAQFNVNGIAARGTMILRELEDASTANGLCGPATAPGGSCPVAMPYAPQRLPFPACDPVLGDPTAQVCDVTTLHRSTIALSTRTLVAGGAVNISVSNDWSLEGSWGRRLVDPTGPGTRISWDPDGAGPEPNEIEFNVRGCLCCDALGPQCTAVFPFQNYPALVCPQANNPAFRGDSQDWVFDGAAVGPWGNWEHEVSELPNSAQVYGVCMVDRDTNCDRAAPAAPGTAHCQQDAAVECASDVDCVGLGFCRNDATGFPAGPTDCPDIAGQPQACDYREWGLRFPTGRLLPDTGTPNPNICAGAQYHLAGTPGTGCTIVERLAVDGDPGPRCEVPNFGVEALPDENCDFVADSPDLCPDITEFGPTYDANGDGIGDECQCGDATLDGAVTGLDIGATALCANSVATCNTTIADADGDRATTALDIGGVVSVVNGTAPASSLTCSRSL